MEKLPHWMTEVVLDCVMFIVLFTISDCDGIFTSPIIG